MNNSSSKKINQRLTFKKHKYSYWNLKTLCKELGLTNSKIYRNNYKKFDLPAHPERIYDEWISYRDFFNSPQFITYQELKALIEDKQLKNGKEYKAFIFRQDDERLPLDPQTVYADEWENWYAFLGKPEPFKPEFIPDEYRIWRYKIEEFMKTARGGESKLSNLCRFVRLYIMPYDNSKSPHAFLTQGTFDLKPLKLTVEGLNGPQMRKAFLKSANEFLDYIISNELTAEDEDTGEIIRVKNARNPLTLYTDQVSKSSSTSNRSETTKPCLQYQFVKNAQTWLIPENVKNFRELEHLQIFDADWVKVDRDLIDITDEDCVYKYDEGNYYLWIPIDWIMLFSLIKIPLRGRQIAYNDSGEADKYIADLDQAGEIVWVENPSPFAGLTNKQSFVSKMQDDQLGIFTTTNKTNNDGKGYIIPWIPEDLAYWIIKLRKWQQKFNPISKPTAWTECIRTSFNEVQLKERGINCFLFRRFMDIEPANITNSLTARLAIALYNIQPKSLVLSKLNGNSSAISAYNSIYTPHSMRVSLITAYVMEMAIPIEVVMKIVGHSSIVMSIYYCKVSNQDIRQRLEEGEKIALKSEAESIQKTIEQQKIEDIKNQLIGTNQEMLLSLNNSVPAGNFVFRDYGICPYAATKCDSGGEAINNLINAPAPTGYLGTQNCLRCRHFVTGPAFLGGLIAIANEVLLQSNDQSSACLKLQEEIIILKDEIQALERKEYLANIKGIEFSHNDEHNRLEVDLRNVESQYETLAMKLDMYLCDIQACHGHIKRCQSIMNQNTDSSKLELITSSTAEVQLEIEEVSHFQQLQEVCENATIYRSCGADNAILPRTQILDTMVMYNEMMPRLFTLSKEQQLRAGNQIYKLLLGRLQTWSKIQPLIDCKVMLKELEGPEKIESFEIDLILSESSQKIGFNE